jgi:hypothetical protein
MGLSADFARIMGSLLDNMYTSSARSNIDKLLDD